MSNTTVVERVLHSTIMREGQRVNACGAPIVERDADTVYCCGVCAYAVTRSVPCAECGAWFSRQEAAIKPDFDKVIGQWQRGMITSSELVSALDNIYYDQPMVP